MDDNLVIDFSVHLNKKRQNEVLNERIKASGWEIKEGVSSANSDACFYLIDSIEPGVVVFGCSKDRIETIGPKDIVHWGHFVLAWDVIADPQMPFDDTHKKKTMELALQALPGLPRWRSFSEKAFATEGNQKAHILVLIDRDNFDLPINLIVVQSESPVMDYERICSIVDSSMTLNDGED